MTKSSGLEGPFDLTKDGIKNAVTKISPGAYALGEKRSDGVFYISYVGRADSDLGNRLSDHVGNYKHFKATYLDTALAAFYKECHLYHDFSPPDNKIHPDRPKNSGAECPVCTIFDK